MAGRGPAPKDADQRARANPPERGEWVGLPPLDTPVLPLLPKRTAKEEPWSARTRRTWASWREDWVTGAFGPSEIAMAIDLAYVFEDAVRDSKPTRWAEVRQWMDRLGLTMKGKRDLRLTLVAPEILEAADAEDPFAGLRLVDDAVAS
jgi:hypothetical protein